MTSAQPPEIPQNRLRWGAALSLVGGGEGNDDARSLLRGRRMSSWWLLVVAALGLAGSVWIGVDSIDALPARSSGRVVAVDLGAAGFIVSGLSLVAIAVGWTWRVRRRDPAVVLTRAQRLRVASVITGRRRLDTALDPLIRDVAHRSRFAWEELGVRVGCLLILVSFAYGRSSPLNWLFPILWLVVAASIVGQRWRLVRSAHEYVAAPPPDSSG